MQSELKMKFISGGTVLFITLVMGATSQVSRVCGITTVNLITDLNGIPEP